MNGEHEKWSELLPWYANDTLDASARTALEVHLRDCPACREELETWRRISNGVRAQPAPALPRDVRCRLASLARPQPWRSLRHIPLLLRSQLPVIRAEIWPASALVLALGALVTLATAQPGSDGLLFVLLAPLVAALGIAFLYGPLVDPALEVELATPTSPRLVLLARLLLVFGFDLALALAGSLALALFVPDLSLWPLVSAWLAPMAFLSALSLLLSMLAADPGLGSLVSLVLWALQAIGRLPGDLPLRLPDLTATATHPWLWALALLMGALAVWVSGREERWMRGAA